MTRQVALQQARKEIRIEKWYCVIDENGQADYHVSMALARLDRNTLIAKRVKELEVV